MKSTTPRYLQYTRLGIQLSPSAHHAVKANASFAWTSRNSLSSICARVTELSNTLFAHCQPIVIQHRNTSTRSSECYLLHPEDLFALLCLTHKPTPDLALAILQATKGAGDCASRLAVGIRALEVATQGFLPSGNAPTWGAILQHGNTYLVGGDPCRFDQEEGHNILVNLATGERSPASINDMLPLEPIDLSPPSVFQLARKR
jgi:hypothetical protein